jgi:DNA-binding MarR family transcriptional regulator
MPQETEAPTTLSIDLLDRAAAITRHCLEQILLPHELTLDAWRVLQTLCVDGPLSMGTLGEATRTTAPTLTRIVDRLVDRSLVYRNVDPADRRRLLIHASERGRGLQQALQKPLQQAETAALINFSAKDIQTLRVLLERLG